jgi:hypothetical protein
MACRQAAQMPTARASTPSRSTGAHGHLIDQFFWSGTNKREERQGEPERLQRR